MIRKALDLLRGSRGRHCQECKHAALLHRIIDDFDSVRAAVGGLPPLLKEPDWLHELRAVLGRRPPTASAAQSVHTGAMSGEPSQPERVRGGPAPMSDSHGDQSVACANCAAALCAHCVRNAAKGFGFRYIVCAGCYSFLHTRGLEDGGTPSTAIMTSEDVAALGDEERLALQRMRRALRAHATRR